MDWNAIGDFIIRALSAGGVAGIIIAISLALWRRHSARRLNGMDAWGRLNYILDERKKENAELRKRLNDLEAKIDSSETERAELSVRMAAMEAEIETLQKENAELKEENKRLRRKISELNTKFNKKTGPLGSED